MLIRLPDLTEGKKVHDILSSVSNVGIVIDLFNKPVLRINPEHIAVREMRKHIGWYLHGLRGAARIRVEINRAEKPEQVWDILDRLRRETESRQAGESSFPSEGFREGSEGRSGD